MVTSTSDTVLRAHPQKCCCNRCETYGVCNECCKCLPKTICVDFDYTYIHGYGTCECDHRYVTMEYDCNESRWEGSFKDCTDAALDDLFAWVTAGRTLEFDGVQEFLSPTSAPLGTTDPFTLQVWFKTEATSGTLFSETSTSYITASNSPLIRVRLNAGKIEATVRNDANEAVTQTTASTYNDGAWHCLTLRFESTDPTTWTVDLWIDSTQTTPIASGSVTSSAMTTDLCRIACDWDHASGAETDYYAGRLYMLALYDRHIESGEITAFCNCSRSNDYLINLWKMHRGFQLTPIRDHIGDNHATMNYMEEEDWKDDRPDGCRECVFVLYSDCLDDGVPLEEPLAAPRADPNPEGVVECWGWSYAQRNGPSFSNVIVSSACVEPSGDCTRVDIVVGSALGIRIPKDPDVDGCEFMCGGEECPCICQEICLTLTLDELGEITEFNTVLGDYPADVICTSTEIRWPFDLSATSGLGNYKTISGNLIFRRAATGNDCVLVVETNQYGNSDEVIQACPDVLMQAESWDATTDITVTADVTCHTCGDCESQVTVSCCPDPVPSTLTATLSSFAQCSCVNGHTGTLTYNSATGQWTGTVVTDGDCGVGDNEVMTVTITLYCLIQELAPPEWRMQVVTSCDGGSTDTGDIAPVSGTLTCDPFFAESGAILDESCCNSSSLAGEFIVQITE